MSINNPQNSKISLPTRALMTRRRELAETETINNERVRRNMQPRPSKRKQEIEPRDHTINDHDIKEPEESLKNA